MTDHKRLAAMQIVDDACQMVTDFLDENPNHNKKELLTRIAALLTESAEEE